MEYLDFLSVTENLIHKIIALATLKLSSMIKKNRWDLWSQICLTSTSLVILDKSLTSLSLFFHIAVSGDYNICLTGWHEN